MRQLLATIRVSVKVGRTQQRADAITPSRPKEKGAEKYERKSKSGKCFDWRRETIQVIEVSTL